MLLIGGLLLMPSLHARADISLDQAVEQVKQRVGGRVIKAETRERNGVRIHNIRILGKDGKVHRKQIRANGARRDGGRRR